nr:HAD-IC family P-type ATPase [Gammaproteobacteria bacterium]
INDLVISALDAVGFRGISSSNVIKKTRRFSHAFLGGTGLFLGFSLLFLSVLFPTLPFALTTALSLFSAALTVGLGWPFYRRAYHGFWQGIWSMDTLFSMSTAVILGVSLGALFFPALPMMFEAGLLIFGFRHTGIALSDAFKANLLSIRRFQDDVPQYVTREKGDKAETVSLKMIGPGNQLCLSVGDVLPVDGVFTSGSGMVSSLYQTGSNQHSPLVINQLYPAGTKLVSIIFPLKFRARASANDSFLAREDRAILQSRLNRALEKKPPKANSVDYWLQFFVPAVAAVAACSGIITGLYFGSWVLAVQTAVSVLVAACPCTLGLIAPLVRHIGLKKANKAGFAFREPEHLDVLDTIDAVMLDLNGTMTLGEACVLHPEAKPDLLALMAHLEMDEEHWVASAIKKAAHGLPFRGGACERLSSVHNGHHVQFDGKEYVLGNRLMMQKLGITNHALDVQLGAIGEHVVYLAEDNQLIGHLILEDKMRDGAEQVVRELQASGKKVFLCTGSDKATAHRYATAFKIPLDHVFADCTVDGDNSKQAHLEALEKQGYRVAFGGDAGNDARVIACSKFGFVVEHDGGHVGTQQGASAVLKTKSLLPLLQLFHIARNTTSNINQNVRFSFAYNLMAVLAPTTLLFGLGLVLNPAVGAALMIVQTLCIFANVYRFDKKETACIPTSKSSVDLDVGLEALLGNNYSKQYTLSPQSFVPKAIVDSNALLSQDISAAHVASP